MACGIGCSLSGTAGNEEVWSTGERGGRVRAGGLAALARPGSGEGRPLLSWLPIPGVGTGTCPDGTERKAGRAWASGRRQEWPALRPGILARLQHRPRRPGIAGTARPSFSVVWRAPGRLGAEPARTSSALGTRPVHMMPPSMTTAGVASTPRAMISRRSVIFSTVASLPEAATLADDLVRFDTFGATGTKDFDDHDAVSFGRILRGSGRAGCVGLPSAVMREGRVRPMPSPA